LAIGFGYSTGVTGGCGFLTSGSFFGRIGLLDYLTGD